MLIWIQFLSIYLNLLIIYKILAICKIYHMDFAE
jgi:hypothetical protein